MRSIGAKYMREQVNMSLCMDAIFYRELQVEILGHSRACILDLHATAPMIDDPNREGSVNPVRSQVIIFHCSSEVGKEKSIKVLYMAHRGRPSCCSLHLSDRILLIGMVFLLLTVNPCSESENVFDP
ncbi:uncharacterized protein LOC122669426 [Telopea speciosissima]|uniref:uncharacterized protein LOC122669426 n=1 Tax=Telopea speciosissima TaxID=54955 RepID=UPI001CC7A1FF|nr:uncharacterized protein LOC122669426 [Telopea speciosissima]